MSVLIKGMEMPTRCSSCPMLEGSRDDGLCHAASRWFDDDEYWTWYVYPEGDMDLSKPCNCPLGELPPHGELISREWLIDIALHLMNTAKNDDIANGVKWLWTYIVDAPTIIEAEDEE